MVWYLDTFKSNFGELFRLCLNITCVKDLQMFLPNIIPKKIDFYLDPKFIRILNCNCLKVKIANLQYRNLQPRLQHKKQ